MKTKQKVLIVTGPTASGKTELAVRAAEVLKGEIISADSRQVFRGMDIGSGKDLKLYGKIPYHLIDIQESGTLFSVSRFQEYAHKALEQIVSKQTFPIICGGTLHYIKALLEDYHFSENPSDLEFSQSLEKLSRDQLNSLLQQHGINEEEKWELHSKRRIVRRLEKKISPTMDRSLESEFKDRYEPIIYATKTPREQLRSNIKARLLERLEMGLLQEVQKLIDKGIDTKRIEGYGLEYKWVSLYLRGQIEYQYLEEKLYVEICRFAKRQETFLRYLEKNGHQINEINNPTQFLLEIEKLK